MIDIKARVLRVMRASGRPMAADKILLDALNIRSPNSHAAKKVLQGILGDVAWVKREKDQWLLALPPSPAVADLQLEASFLCVQRARESVDPFQARGALFLPLENHVWEFEFTGGPVAGDAGALAIARRTAADHPLVFWSPEEARLWNLLLEKNLLERWNGASLCLGRLASLILRKPSSQLLLEDIAMEISVHAPDQESPPSIARFIASVFKSLTSRMPQHASASWSALENWMETATPKIDFSRFAFDKNFLKGLSEGAGIYIMRDRAKRIVYVGKSRCLKRRVQSYFNPGALDDPKVARIHEQLHSLEVCETPNEVEALLLEMRFIRDFRPSINLQAAIHEKPGAYGKGSNIILLSAAEGGDHAQIYLLRRGVLAGQISCRLGVRPPKRVQSRIKSVFFGSSRAKVRRREPWEAELVSRWLASNRRRLNYIDVDHAGDIENTLRQLNSYLMDPDRLARKVIYR